MPWTTATPQPAPAPPAPLVAPGAAPSIPLAPVGHPDHNRAWSRDGAQMTPELQRDTEPYLKAITKMGGDFKTAHTTSSDPDKLAKMEAKLLKRYAAENPLPKNATSAERAMHEQGAAAMLQEFRDKVPTQKVVHDATRDLRNEFKGYDENTYTPDVQDAFEQKYADLCAQAGRTEPSLLEQTLPKNSPLRTKLDPLTGGLRDPSSGLYANMVQVEGKNVLMFGGTGVGGALSAQIQADAGQFLSGVPKAYQQAAALTAQVQSALPPGQSLETAGHSLGGGLANYAALKNGDIKATCFNAAALGGGCKASIGGNLSQAKDNVRHINVDGDGVGDGIGALRVPVQKAADGLNSAASSVTGAANSVLTNAQALGRAAQQHVAQATQPLRQTAAAVGQGVTQAGRAVAGAAGDVKNAASSAVAGVSQTVGGIASNVRQTVGGAASSVAGSISNSAVAQQAVAAVSQSTAGMAVGAAATGAKTAVSETAANAKTSVRDMLRGVKSSVNSGLSSLKEGVQGVGSSLKDTAAGQKVVSAHQAVVKLHDNLGFSQGKLAVPHQYGGCITMDNGGKNNPIGNHLTGAIAKAYDRNAQQNVAVRNQVSIGQQRVGGGGGLGV